MKKRLVILLSLSVTLFFFFIAFVVFGKQKKFRFEKVVRQPSLERFSKDFTSEISSTKIFAERYIRSYSDFLEKEIPKDLRSPFALASKKSVSCKGLLSSVAESFIYLYPADESELIVECAEYPIQLTLMGGLDIAGASTKLAEPYEKALLRYEKMKTPFDLRAGSFGFFFHDVNVESPDPKIFSLSKNCLVTLLNVNFILKDKEGQEIFDMTIKHVGLLTGERDFSFALQKAYELGRELAQSETTLLFISSPFFREVLTYEELKPLAEEIESKRLRAEKDEFFDYPWPLRKRDILNLSRRAAQIGLATDFVDNLLKDAKPYDGWLFWYYRNHAGYMYQWILANVVLLVLSAICLALIRYALHSKSKLANFIRKLANFIRRPRRVALTVVLFINAFILSQKPEFIHIKYILIPGLLFLACVVLSLYMPSKNNRPPK